MSEVYYGLVCTLVNISAGGILILLLAILICHLKHLFSSHFRKIALFVSLTSLVLMLCISITIQVLRIPTPKPLFMLPDRQTFSHISEISVSNEDSNVRNYDSICETSGYSMRNNMVNAVPGWFKAVILLWGSGSLLFAASLLLGLQNAAKIKKASFPINKPTVADLIAELKIEAHVNLPVEVLCHDSVFSPLTFGFRKPVIILPKEANDWSTDRLKVVLLHELLHVKRKDSVSNLLVRIVCILFWFNPFVWIASRRYHFIQETSCDDRILEMGVNPHFYAEELVRLTFLYKHLKPRFTLSNSLYGKSTTEKRVTEILESKKARHTIRYNSILSLILFVLVLSISLSFVSFVGASTATFPGIPGPLDTPDLWPVLDGSGIVSSRYGDSITENTKSCINNGMDITSNNAIPVVASANGDIISTESNSVTIGHKGGFSTYYGNLCIISVSVGQSVTKGQLIGYCYTGRIHFEIAKGSTSLDPMTILKSR